MVNNEKIIIAKMGSHIKDTAKKGENKFETIRGGLLVRF